MVLIGSYIPHLNFDYGVKTKYEKIVVHLRADFLRQNLEGMPELNALQSLLIESQHGIAFGSETKRLLGTRLKELPELSHFTQFLAKLHLGLLPAVDQILKKTSQNHEKCQRF